MKKINLLLFTLALTAVQGRAVELESKSIYVPRDLQAMDLDDPASKWSRHRMVTTDNLVLFWAPGFGDNVADAPDLDGKSMKVDMANLLARAEQVYRFYYNDLGFVKPGTKADRYKMMMMLDYTSQTTVYGGAYDNEIGATWIAPNRIQDKKLNALAHELAHSFQYQIACDGEGEFWGGHDIVEMAAQWMLWHVNHEWPTDENYHLKAFRKNTHLAFLHADNKYRSPYILEYWAEKHGNHAIADLFRAGRRGEDPVETYRRLHGLDQEAFNDEMFDAVRHMVNWDLKHAHEIMRAHANIWDTPTVQSGRWLMPDTARVPQDYGFNIVKLDVPAAGKTLRVKLEGQSADKDAGWRYGLVAVDSEGASTYGEMKRGNKGTLSYTAPADGPAVEHLWLVVMGAPKTHRQLSREQTDNRQWNYRFSIR